MKQEIWNTNCNMQQLLHNKEENFIEFLRQYCERNNIPFKDVHEDTSTGIDIYLDGKPYDLKVSNTYLLSVFRYSKYYGDKWKCPLVEHQDIPYMYIIEEDTRYIGRCIKKDALLREDVLNRAKFIETDKDGNINVCIDLKDIISDISYDFEVFGKFS